MQENKPKVYVSANKDLFNQFSFLMAFKALKLKQPA